MSGQCKTYIKVGLVFILLSLMSSRISANHGTGFEIRVGPKLKPTAIKKPEETERSSKSISRTYISCFDYYTGIPGNCSFKYVFRGVREPIANVENNGGHRHSPGSRPEILDNGKIKFLFDKNPLPKEVEGNTINQTVSIAKLEFEVPEVAGILSADLIVIAPPGASCADYCFDHNSWKIKYSYFVGYEGLQELPASPSGLYVKGRDPDDPHHADDVAFYGTPFTISSLGQIASVYKIFGKRLSVNDMSLPYGGLFDIQGGWSVPHRTHHEGTDADINRNDGTNTVNCQDDRYLRLAADLILNGSERNPNLNLSRRPSALLCESGGRKHIDFD